MIDLYWIPLGADGNFVRFNGRVYEAIRAALERRPRQDLYHTALEVQGPETRFIVETAWPIPDADGTRRGVVVEGPVGTRGLARLRALRYEVRRWPGGTIPDVSWAVGGPQRISNDPTHARAVWNLAEQVPPLLWGRDERHLGEMWNSNSVISWLLAGAGLDTDAIHPPAGGRAPGWDEGIALARRRP